ncbi:hypothetical protein AYO44_10540 [Planctomycetaceae bacterium SCGC AG-212-F19]|nr:hypothetical protein AYO44_10540 [Planctomycetaceae bacterium SCGC AG-212-F19]
MLTAVVALADACYGGRIVATGHSVGANLVEKGNILGFRHLLLIFNELSGLFIAGINHELWCLTGSVLDNEEGQTSKGCQIFLCPYIRIASQFRLLMFVLDKGFGLAVIVLQKRRVHNFSLGGKDTI